MNENSAANFSEVHSWKQKHDVEKIAKSILLGNEVSIRIAYGVLAELSKYASPLFADLHDALEQIHPHAQATILREILHREYHKYSEILRYAHPTLLQNEQELLGQNKIHAINLGNKSLGTVLVFTTLFNNFYMTKVVLSSILAQCGYSVIIVNDSSGYYYLNGINSSLNTWNKTMGELQKKINELGTKNLIITGFSSGGYAALLASIELIPDYFVIFSGTVDLEKNSSASFPKLFRDRDGQVTPSELRRNLSLELLESKLKGRFFSGAKSIEDCSQLLKVSPSEAIKTSIIPDEGHICFRGMFLDGSFEKMFRGCCQTNANQSLNGQ